jgi:hypothetical protein
MQRKLIKSLYCFKELYEEINNNYYNLDTFVFVRNASEYDLLSDLVCSFLKENDIDISFKDFIISLQISGDNLYNDEFKHEDIYKKLLYIEIHKNFIKEYLTILNDIMLKFPCFTLDKFTGAIEELKNAQKKYIIDQHENLHWIIILHDSLIYNILFPYIEDLSSKYEQYKGIITNVYYIYSAKWISKYRFKSILSIHLQLCCMLCKVLDKMNIDDQYSLLKEYIQMIVPNITDENYYKEVEIQNSELFKFLFTYNNNKKEFSEFIFKFMEFQLETLSCEYYMFENVFRKKKEILSNVFNNIDLLKYSINFFDNYFQSLGTQNCFRFKIYHNKLINNKSIFDSEFCKELEEYEHIPPENQMCFNFIFMQICTRYIQLDFDEYFANLQKADEFSDKDNIYRKIVSNVLSKVNIKIE